MVAGFALGVAGKAAAGVPTGCWPPSTVSDCHGVDKKLVGPGFKDIAKKYAGDAGALEKLEAKVRDGSSGVWGQIPMPPNSVPDADLKTLVEWILSLK
jgi:cytochrome c